MQSCWRDKAAKGSDRYARGFRGPYYRERVDSEMRLVLAGIDERGSKTTVVSVGLRFEMDA